MKNLTTTAENTAPGFPKQKIPESQKTEKWYKQNVDAILYLSSSHSDNDYEPGDNRKQRISSNRKLVKGYMDLKDVAYVLNPYNQDVPDNQPSEMRNYNQIRPKKELLKGEELKRPDKFRVVGVNGPVVSEVNKAMHATVVEEFTKMVLAEAGIMEETEQGVQPPQADIEGKVEAFSKTYQDIREQIGNYLLNNYNEKLRLKHIFNKGWDDALETGEEIYYIGITRGHPVVRRVNPEYFDYDHSPDLEKIEDARWAREERWLNASQIIDEYGEYLSESEIERIERNEVGYTFGDHYPEYRKSDYLITPDNFMQKRYSSTSHIHVVTCVWKSLREIVFLKGVDPNTGQEIEKIVDAKYELSDQEKELGFELEKEWITDICQGTRIGRDIYVELGPVANQVRSQENISYAPLPYVGRIYPTCLVDVLKPHQYLYNIIWFRLEAELAKAKGKAFVMDIAQIPKSKGMDLDKWMYYFDNVGVAFVNSMELGREGDPNSVAKFNQFNSIDRTLSATIGQYVEIINKLEQIMGDIVGINKQREGGVTRYETAGGVERAVTQSSHITEPWFFLHDETKRQVRTYLINAAKIAYLNGANLSFVTPDLHRKMLDIDGEVFADSDYGVFVTDSQKENILFEKIDQLAQAALQNQMLGFSDMIKALKTDSSSEKINIIEQGEEKLRQAQREQMESNERMKQAEIEAAERKDANDKAFEAEQNQLDRESRIQERTIQALGFSEDKDMDKNDVNDVIQQQQIALQQIRDAHEVSYKNKELSLKEKELSQKAKNEKEKQKLEKHKIDTQLKIAKENKNRYD